jgi:ferredoxin
MKRKIIKIDEEKCNGCGLCIPECKEGALQIINGKVKLISDLFCDGLGACIGYCPEGAIIVEEREAEAYNEKLVLEKISKEKEVLAAHLMHLIEHNDEVHLAEALEFLAEKNIQVPVKIAKDGKVLADSLNYHHGDGHGCPGMKVIDNKQKPEPALDDANIDNHSQLRQWPIQLHLVPPNAPYFRNTELLVMSTCGPVASANIHNDYLKGRSIVIACPKLDYTAPYKDKMAEILSNPGLNRAIIVIMEVPCCKGLSKIVTDAAEQSSNNNLTIEEHIMTLDGKIRRKAVIFERNLVVA